MQKESLRTKGFGGRYSRYFAGSFALRRRRNSIRRYSATPEREFESQFSLLPLDNIKVLRFYDFALILPMVSSCYQQYSVSPSEGKLIPNSALFIYHFVSFTPGF